MGVNARLGIPQGFHLKQLTESMMHSRAIDWGTLASHIVFPLNNGNCRRAIFIGKEMWEKKRYFSSIKLNLFRFKPIRIGKTGSFHPNDVMQSVPYTQGRLPEADLVKGQLGG